MELKTQLKDTNAELKTLESRFDFFKSDLSLKSDDQLKAKVSFLSDLLLKLSDSMKTIESTATDVIVFNIRIKMCQMNCSSN